MGVRLEHADGATGTPLWAGMKPDSTFECPQATPGKYWLIAEVENLITRVPVTVGEGGLDGLEIRLAPKPKVRLVVHAPGSKQVDVILRQADSSTGMAFAANHTDSGVFLEPQYSGRFWVVTRSEYCPLKGEFGKTDPLTQTIDITDGSEATLELWFSDQCGSMNAEIIAAGKPLPNARTAILLSGTPDVPGDLFLGSADEKGIFGFFGMPAGKYLLWAWNEDEEWNGDVADLPEMATRATAVEVKVGETAKVQVPVMSFGEGSR